MTVALAALVASHIGMLAFYSARFFSTTGKELGALAIITAFGVVVQSVAIVSLPLNEAVWATEADWVIEPVLGFYRYANDVSFLFAVLYHLFGVSVGWFFSVLDTWPSVFAAHTGSFLVFWVVLTLGSHTRREKTKILGLVGVMFATDSLTRIIHGTMYAHDFIYLSIGPVALIADMRDLALIAAIFCFLRGLVRHMKKQTREMEVV